MIDAGRFLHERRIANALSQAQLADRAGTSRAAISDLEQGGTSPTVEALAQLLGAMGEELVLDTTTPARARNGRPGLLDRARSIPGRLRPLVSDLLYERRLGVDTSGILVPEELNADSCHYEPVPWRLLQRWVRPEDVSADDVLLDVGCGKGRIVLQAARLYPFARVIGTDLSPALLAVARHNIDHTRARLRCRNVELVAADAATWEIPDDVTIVTFHNSFGGATFEQFIGRLLASVDRRPRRVRLLYVHPLEQAALEATGRFELVSASPTMSEPPGSAVASGSTSGVRLYSVLAPASSSS